MTLNAAATLARRASQDRHHVNLTIYAAVGLPKQPLVARHFPNSVAAVNRAFGRATVVPLDHRLSCPSRYQE